jgi:hypothetical protein
LESGTRKTRVAHPERYKKTTFMFGVWRVQLKFPDTFEADLPV